jgi:hypothetical protein
MLAERLGPAYLILLLKYWISGASNGDRRESPLRPTSIFSSTRAMRMSTAVAIALALIVGGCDPPAHDITFTNGTDLTLYVYEVQNGHPTTPRQVAPGAAVIDQWFVARSSADASKAPARKIEAADSAGNIVYCAELTYRELEAIEWRVSLTRTGPCRP